MSDVESDRDIGRVEAIIRSMTPGERVDPKIINAGRKQRIAVGSGTSRQEVSGVLQAVRSGAEDDAGLLARQGYAGHAEYSRDAEECPAGRYARGQAVAVEGRLGAASIGQATENREKVSKEKEEEVTPWRSRSA